VTTNLKCLVFIYYITAPSCSTVPASNLMQKTGATAWTLYAFNYTAVTTAPTLIFGFNNGPADASYLDDVSVVNTNAPLIQLLNNPSFENSTSVLTSWVTWCQSGCASATYGIVINSSCHSGNCYFDQCKNANDYLAQSFSATTGNIYTISFWLYQSGGSAGKFYATI
jgi:hypothetical protein